MKRKDPENPKGKNPAAAVAVSVLAAYAVTAVVFVIYACLLTYTDMTEKYMQTVITLTVAASVVTGGFLSGRAVKKRGIVWGMLSGAVYAAIMIIFGCCAVPDFAFGTKTVLIVLVSVCGGGLGGIVGINI